MTIYDPDEFVYMTNPATSAVGGPVTREAFETLHKAKGWTETTDPADIAKTGPEYRGHEARKAASAAQSEAAPGGVEPTPADVPPAESVAAHVAKRAHS